MLFGFDDRLKPLKKDLKEAGADMSVVKDWQKTYDKVIRQSPQFESQYTQVKSELELVYKTLEGMEKLLISSKEGMDLSKLEVRGQIAQFVKELKKYQGNFNHEFLISKEDSEFHLTYATLLELCSKPLQGQGQVLILQSEVENLMALAKEALEKNWPSFQAMAFYYINRSDKEIFDLPHQDKVAKVERVYENEFIKPMQQLLQECINCAPDKISILNGKKDLSVEAAVDYILKEWIWE